MVDENKRKEGEIDELDVFCSGNLGDKKTEKNDDISPMKAFFSFLLTLFSALLLFVGTCVPLGVSFDNLRVRGGVVFYIILFELTLVFAFIRAKKMPVKVGIFCAAFLILLYYM